MVKLSSHYRKVKYLGILEADNFLEEKMKLNVSKEYIRSLRKLLKSKLSGGNLFVELTLGQYSYYNIQQHLLAGGKVNCTL